MSANIAQERFLAAEVTWLKLLGSCGAHEEAYDTVKTLQSMHRVVQVLGV